MSKKIQITQEQEQTINEIRDTRAGALMAYIQGGLSDYHKSLNNLSFDELARILYEPNSYEVVPEFKIGDWVVHLPSGIIAKVSKVIDNGNVYIDAYGINTLPKFFRYATPEEIEQEKERRFWHENGREEWELRGGDTLITPDNDLLIVNDLLISNCDSNLSVELYSIRQNAFIECRTKDLMNYYIYCFKEDRKTVIEGESV